MTDEEVGADDKVNDKVPGDRDHLSSDLTDPARVRGPAETAARSRMQRTSESEHSHGPTTPVLEVDLAAIPCRLGTGGHDHEQTRDPG